MKSSFRELQIGEQMPQIQIISQIKQKEDNSNKKQAKIQSQNQQNTTYFVNTEHQSDNKDINGVSRIQVKYEQEPSQIELIKSGLDQSMKTSKINALNNFSQNNQQNKQQQEREKQSKKFQQSQKEQMQILLRKKSSLKIQEQVQEDSFSQHTQNSSSTNKLVQRFNSENMTNNLEQPHSDVQQANSITITNISNYNQQNLEEEEEDDEPNKGKQIQEEQKSSKRWKQRTTQSLVKNANRFYFQKIIKYLKEQFDLQQNQNQNLAENQNPDIRTVVQETYQLAKIKPQSINLKFFRLCCMKLNAKNLEQIKQQKDDQILHQIVFKNLWENQKIEKINAIKQELTIQISQYLRIFDFDKEIQGHSIQKQIEIQKRYRDWKDKININLNKLNAGQFVIRF